MSDSKSGSGDAKDLGEVGPRPTRRIGTIAVGGVAAARGEAQRSVMPASIRKHAYLSVVSGSRKFSEIDLESDVTTIGRGPDVDFVLDEPSASRQHVTITKASYGHVLRDLGSTNGTYLKGILHDDSRPLEDDDCFRIGGTELVYHAPRRED